MADSAQAVNLASVAAKGDPTSVGTVPTPEEIVAVVDAAEKVNNQAPPRLADNRAISEQVAELFAEMNLSSAFTTKATALVEAFVAERVAAETERLVAFYEEKSQLYIDEEVIPNLNKYATYAATEWLNENKLAVESSLKLEAAEKLLSGLKNIITESAVINITEEEENKFVQYEKEIKTLREQLNEAVSVNMQIKEEREAATRASILEEATVNLTAVDKARVQKISESITAPDLDTFKAKITAVVESYIPAKNPLKTGAPLNEAVTPPVKTNEKSPQMKSYVEAFKLLA